MFSTCSSITCRAGNEYQEKAGKVNSTKVYMKNGKQIPVEISTGVPLVKVKLSLYLIN
jgi:hypothetical protein